MSFIVDINKDSHRVFLRRLHLLRIRLVILWKKECEYCLDNINHKDYTTTKLVQIKMHEKYKDIPIV